MTEAKMQDRKIIEESLSGYPDLLTLADLQKALGGFCDTSADMTPFSPQWPTTS